MIKNRKTHRSKSRTRRPNPPTKQNSPHCIRDKELTNQIKELEVLNRKSMRLLSSGIKDDYRWLRDTVKNRLLIMEFFITKAILPFYMSSNAPNYYFPEHNIICVSKAKNCIGYEKPELIMRLILSEQQEEAIEKNRKLLLKKKPKGLSSYEFFKENEDIILSFLRGLKLKMLGDFVENVLPRRGNKVEFPCFRGVLNFKSYKLGATKVEEISELKSFRVKARSSSINSKKQKISKQVESSSKKREEKLVEIYSPVKRLKVSSQAFKTSISQFSEIEIIVSSQSEKSKKSSISNTSEASQGESSSSKTILSISSGKSSPKSVLSVSSKKSSSEIQISSQESEHDINAAGNSKKSPGATTEGKEPVKKPVVLDSGSESEEEPPVVGKDLDEMSVSGKSSKSLSFQDLYKLKKRMQRKEQKERIERLKVAIKIKEKIVDKHLTIAEKANMELEFYQLKLSCLEKEFQANEVGKENQRD